MRRRLFSQEQLQEAIKLRRQGYSKRMLADHFNVGLTTVWDNVFAHDKNRRNKIRVISYKDIKTFLMIVSEFRDKGLTSIEIANQFQVPVKEINIIWCKTL